REQTVTGVSLSRATTDAEDITLRNSLIDGALYPDSGASACVSTNCNRTNLINNTYKNSRNGVTGGTGSRSLKVNGGKMINIGAAATPATTFNQYVYDQDTTKSGIVDDVEIIDGVCGSVGFNGVKTIKNTTFENTVSPTNWIAQEVAEFDNNKGVPFNVRMDENGGSCKYNEFSHAASGANGCIRLNAISGCIVTGNTAPSLTSGDGIEEAAGSDSNLISFNNMSGRPTNLVGAVSIANALSNI
ncbi:MAG: hypothetical protein KAT90_09160, partial [Gammaproteobacteria bacterium]|nr:hypothetical protein [Gammaproteobacteria bacterium]